VVWITQCSSCFRANTVWLRSREGENTCLSAGLLISGRVRELLMYNNLGGAKALEIDEVTWCWHFFRTGVIVRTPNLLGHRSPSVEVFPYGWQGLTHHLSRKIHYQPIKMSFVTLCSEHNRKTSFVSRGGTYYDWAWLPCGSWAYHSPWSTLERSKAGSRNRLISPSCQQEPLNQIPV
jgi:hypothetical protein